MYYYNYHLKSSLMFNFCLSISSIFWLSSIYMWKKIFHVILMWHKDILRILYICHRNIPNIFIHTHWLLFTSSRSNVRFLTSLSLLQSNNKTNSSHLETCSIITKTYWLCWGVKLNWLAKSKLHRYPSPIIGKGYKWNIGAFKYAQIWSYTMHLIFFCWTCNCIICYQYYVWSKLYVCWTPKWPNSSWARLATLSHCYDRDTTFTYPFAHIRWRELPSHLNHLALCTTLSFSLSVNPIRTSLACKYAMTCASS